MEKTAINCDYCGGLFYKEEAERDLIQLKVLVGPDLYFCKVERKGMLNSCAEEVRSSLG